MADRQQPQHSPSAAMQQLASLLTAAAATAAAGAAAAWYWRSSTRQPESQQRSASAAPGVDPAGAAASRCGKHSPAALRSGDQFSDAAAGTATPLLQPEVAAPLAVDSGSSWVDYLPNSWGSGGAEPTSLRAISAQAELQTSGGGGGGGSGSGSWDNVLARKSELLGTGSTDTPPLRHDPPRQAWWSQTGSSGGGGGGCETSAADEAAEGIAHISELLLYHDAEGAPEMLGRGGFGQVYRARFRDEDVAVKVFVITDQDRSEAKFRQEIDLLKSCTHDNVVGFKAACLDAPHHLMLVMELLQGGDLQSALDGDTDGRLMWHRRDSGLGRPPRQGLGKAIALDIARGLAFLHAQHIVHLDLKSPNVLLTANNTAKVGDVGLARLMPNDYMSAQAALGTFSWTAPEVLMGGKCGNKVDIFSYGVILWEIVTGEAPHRGRMRPVRVPEECPQGVADLIAACMEEQPGHRPSAAEIVALLESDPAQLEARRIKPFRVSIEAECAPTHVTQRDKEACVQRYDAAFTFFHGSWDDALAAGYTSPPVETALDDVRACEVAGYHMAVDILQEWLARPDAETPGSETRAKIEEFTAVTTAMYYQKLRFSDRFLQTIQTRDVLETVMKAEEKAAASRDIGGQSVEEVDWRGILSTLHLTEQQADALAKARLLVARETEQLQTTRSSLVTRLQALTTSSEDTDFEAAVEVSQTLRRNMQREARLSYKFERWFGTELLTPLQFARVAAGAWPVVVADGLRIGAALLAERGTSLVPNN